MAEKKAEAGEEQASGSKLKWIILILLVLVVLMAGGGAAYYFLVLKGADETAEAGPVDEAAAKAAAEAEAAAALAKAPLIYHELEPFTANITAAGPVRFLRVKVTIVTKNQAVVDAVDKHMPLIRNDLLSILASQDSALINTREGKETLRQTLKETVMGILTRATEPSGVEDVLFTEFVMQ